MTQSPFTDAVFAMFNPLFCEWTIHGIWNIHVLQFLYEF